MLKRACLFILLLTLTTHCGKASHNSLDDGSVIGGLGGISLSQCEENLMESFEVSYRPVLSDPSKCLHCHTEGGPSPYKFASSHLPTAFSTFMSLGASQIDQNAQDPAHAPGVSGTGMTAAIASARSVWDPAYTSFLACQNPTATTVSFAEQNSADLYFGDGRTVTLFWYLDSASVTPASARVPGVFSLDVKVNYRSGLAVGYVFANPRMQLYTGESEVDVQSVVVRINGVEATGMQNFLNAAKIAKGLDATVLYTGSVASDLPAVSTGDKISVSFVKYNVRNRTDNPPIPAAATIRANNLFTNSATVGITVGNDSTARRWCVTHLNTRPTSTAVACPGFEGNTVTNGWSASRPNTFSLNTLGRVVNSGEVITMYVWIANSDLKISATAGSGTVTFDNVAPAPVTWSSLSVTTTQIADFVGLTNSNETVTWCAIEGSTNTSVQNVPGNCNFSATKPTFVGLKGGGTRYVNVFVRDLAGNTSGATIKTVSNPFGAITYSQLASSMTGERGVFHNNCVSCHGAGMPQQAKWDSSSYANTVALKNKILSRINDSANPMPPTGMMDERTRALIRLWFTQTTTPVQ